MSQTTFRLRGTDPALVRLVLAYAEQTTINQARKRFDLSHRTVSRWVRAREVMGPDWPSLDLDREYRDSEARRAKKATRLAAYRKRKILNGGDPLMVDATGTHRRIQALMVLGHTSSTIASHGPWGTGEAVLEYLTRDRVMPQNAQSIARVYDRLSMTPGRPALGRRRALAKGWVPPLAWDEHTIDDPAAAPFLDHPSESDEDTVDHAVIARVLAGDPIPANDAERRVIVARWRALGRPTNQLYRLTGWKPEKYAPPADFEEAS